MSAMEINEARIWGDYRQMAITTGELDRYRAIARNLASSHATSTYSLAKALDAPCADTRRELRRMERRGYVVADSNGSNNIYWSLKP
jgi:DNA-binding IclR family transcriptional regulator